jgi:hypothetical protein
MSWSISTASKNKEETLKEIRSQAVTASANYKPGTPEGDDIVAAVARVEALVAALVSSDNVNVSVSAYGSHSRTDAGITNASFSVSVGVAS